MSGSGVLVGVVLAIFLSAPAFSQEAPAADTPTAAVTVTGEVLRAADSSPVAGARVVATSGFPGGGRRRRGGAEAASGERPVTSSETTTAADGTFSLPLPVGRHQLTVSAAELETVSRPLRVEPELEPIRIELARGVTLRGRVLSTDGTPIAGALLVAPPVGFARSAEDGSFAIEGIPLDDRSIRLIASAHGRLGREVALDFAALERGEPLEVRLDSGRALRVVVKNEEGVVVPGATVTPVDLPGWAGETKPDGPGAFRLTALPDSPVQFDVSAEDHPDHRLVVDGSSAEATLVVTRGREITGAVLDFDGRPVRGASVTIVSSAVGESTSVGAEPETRESDEAGRFRFDGLAFGAYRCDATGPDGARGRAGFTIEPGPGEGKGVEIRLSSAASRSGAAALSDGALPPNQIDWAADFDAAFATAAARSCPVFVAVTMDNESANDAIAATHFRDPGFVEVTRSFVPLVSNPNRHAPSGPCPRYGVVTCDEHQAIEIRVRTELLRSDNIVAPQHLVLAPDREIVERRLFLLSVGDLASFCLGGLARTSPDAAFALAARRIGASGESLRAAPGSPERLRALGDVAALAATGDALSIVALSVSGLDAATPAEAAVVLDSLGRGRSTDAGGVLVALLASKDPGVRSRAARALAGARPNSPEFDALLDRLGVEADADCRSALAAAVGVDLASSIVPPADAETRSRIVAALGRAGVEFATPLLGEELLSGDPDRVVRAAVALAHLRSPQARVLLEAQLVGGSMGRAAAARALGAQGEVASVTALRRALADADPFVRAQSARALGRLRDAGAVESLATLASTEPLSLVRVEAAGALRALGVPAGTETLRRLERDPHAGARASEILAEG